MADQFRYFRIEARELIDALQLALAEIAHGATASGPAAVLLRHAHTLKGAARVVSATTIADLAHALEELLEPYRQAADPVPGPVVSQMQGLIMQITAALAELDAPSAEAAPAPAGRAADAAHPPAEPLAQTARVWLSEIDEVVSGVGAALTRVRALGDCSAQLTQLRAAMRERVATPAEGARKSVRIDQATEAVQRALDAAAEQIDRELREVHFVAERLRLVPASTIEPDLDLAAQDVATEQGKQVQVELSGGEIRLDASVLAAAHTALRQIVRNAVAHGIEVPAQRTAAGKGPAGSVQVRISQSGGQISFSCADDGRGIDLTAVRAQLVRHGSGTAAELETASEARVLELLMHGGVSTAPVLSEVSGRGIGLDVIRDAAERLGGRMGITTRAGAGTTIELVASGSLTAQQVLLVDAGEQAAVPLSAVRTTRRVESAQISRGPAGESLRHEGATLPFLPLATVLDDGPHTAAMTSADQPAWTVLILDTDLGTAALGVRRLIDSAEVAIRPLPELTPAPPSVTGVWLDADGRPRLVLDPDALVQAAVRPRTLDLTPAPARAPILVVDDSLTTRMLEQSILQAAGYEVELAASAEEGLQLATARPYSLVLVDVEMPGMNGFEFIEQTRARAELRHLPCILVTTRSSPEDRQRGIEAGAAGHIDKGEFHQGRLLTRISELLAGG